MIMTVNGNANGKNRVLDLFGRKYETVGSSSTEYAGTKYRE